MKEDLNLHAKHFATILKSFLDEVSPCDSGEKELKTAIEYSLLEGNPKFIRSFLVFETAKMLAGSVNKDVINLAIASEMLHSYTLIHDDLPAMDNSEFRRGVEAVHKKFGESTAILAGNSLQVMAFEVLANLKNFHIIKEFCRVAGLKGVMSGQALDLNPEFKKNEFEEMNYKKTGVLIEFCLTSTAILLKREDIIDKLKVYGKNLGIAYQMQDDLLDEGEEGYSYLTHLGGRKFLEEKLQQIVEICKESIANIPNNNLLFNLPQVLSKRVY